LISAASRSTNADLIVSSGVEWSSVNADDFHYVAPCFFEVGGAMWCVANRAGLKIRKSQVFAHAKEATDKLTVIKRRMRSGEGIIKFANKGTIFAWAFLAMCGERNAFRTEHIGEVLRGIPEELRSLPWILLIPAHRPMSILSHGAGAIKRVSTRNGGSFGPFLRDTIRRQEDEHRPSYAAHVVNFMNTPESRKLAVKVFGREEMMSTYRAVDRRFRIDTYKFPMGAE
jgi:hypothetical protein